MLRAFLGVLAIAAITAGVMYWQSRPQSERTITPSLTQLTTDSGFSVEPAISPDGRWLAYSSDRSGDGNLDIWLQPAGGGSPARLTNNPADDHEPTISPNGAAIAFRSERDGGGIYLVSTTGGEARRIADFGRRPRFSPDGQWIAYWVGPPVWRLWPMENSRYTSFQRPAAPRARSAEIFPLPITPFGLPIARVCFSLAAPIQAVVSTPSTGGLPPPDGMEGNPRVDQDRRLRELFQEQHRQRLPLCDSR